MDSLDGNQNLSTSLTMEKSPPKETTTIEMEETTAENPKETTIIEMEDEVSIELRNTDIIDKNETQKHPKNPIPKQESKTELASCKDVSEKKRCKANKYEIYDVNVPDTNPFRRQPSIIVYFQLTPAPTEDEPLHYDPNSRNGFVRHVVTLTFIMLMSTISFTAAGQFIEPLRNFLTSPVGMVIGIGALILTVVFHYVMFLSTCSRSPPMNYVCLVLATIFWSYLVAWITMRYKMAIIIGAFVATAAIAFVCMLLAMSSFDFTKYLLYFILIAFALAVVMLGLMLAKHLFGFYMKPLHIAILIALVIMDAIMFTTELQMILGGRTVELSVHDYALGAYMLYTSLIRILKQNSVGLTLHDKQEKACAHWRPGMHKDWGKLVDLNKLSDNLS